MKITPVASPHQVRDLSTPEAARTAKAMAAFNAGKSSYDKAPTQGQAQEHPVQNANAVSVEELGAIQPKSGSEQPKSGSTQTTETVDTISTSEEQKPAEETKAEPKDTEQQRRFQQLARQERQLRLKAQQQDQQLKAKEAQLAAKEQELAAKEAQIRQDYVSKSRIKQDALGVLEEAGSSYDEVTQQAITRQPTDPRITATINRLEAKIAELEQSNLNSQKSYQEQQQASYKAAVKQITSDAKALVTSDPEFETIKATNSIRDVVELIEKTYEKTGTVLTVEEAAKEVEEYLVEEAMKLTQVGKIKQRMAQNSASSKPSTQKTQATNTQTQAGMKTLTNAAGSNRKLSARERALLAFKGELKG